MCCCCLCVCLRKDQGRGEKLTRGLQVAHSHTRALSAPPSAAIKAQKKEVSETHQIAENKLAFFIEFRTQFCCDSALVSSSSSPAATIVTEVTVTKCACVTLEEGPEREKKKKKKSVGSKSARRATGATQARVALAHFACQVCGFCDSVKSCTVLRFHSDMHLALIGFQGACSGT